MSDNKIVKCTFRLLDNTEYDVTPIYSSDSEILSKVTLHKSPAYFDTLFTFYLYREEATNPKFNATQIRSKILSLPVIEHKTYDLNNIQG